MNINASPGWTRSCPECNKELVYSRKDNLVVAIQKNRVCKKCAFVGKRNPMFGKHPKSSYGMLGKKHTPEANKKRSNSLRWRKFSKENRRKIRLALLKRFEKLGIIEYFKLAEQPLKEFIKTQVNKDGKVLWNQYINS